jgi:hypothetical protein
MWRLIVPLNYLRITHPEKIKFDLIFPAVFACLFFLPAFSAQFRADVASSIDLVSRSSDLLSILTGFFIAALAAVATFGGEEMNQQMPGSSPMLLPRRHGGPEPLSRRRFLCYLFGYLAFTSLAIYMAGFVFYALQKYVIVPHFPDALVWTFLVFWGLYGFAVGNLLSNTLLGLFYLTDRIHRPNHALTWNSSSQKEGRDEQSASVAKLTAKTVPHV